MLFHIGSLISGVGAWIFAICAIANRQKVKALKNTALSFCFSTLSLLFQFFETNRLVKIEDLSAIMDTSNAVLIASLVLVIINVVLNSAAVCLSRKKTIK